MHCWEMGTISKSFTEEEIKNINAACNIKYTNIDDLKRKHHFKRIFIYIKPKF